MLSSKPCAEMKAVDNVTTAERTKRVRKLLLKKFICQIGSRKRVDLQLSKRQFSSVRSLSWASRVVCHCILRASSSPP